MGRKGTGQAALGGGSWCSAGKQLPTPGAGEQGLVALFTLEGGKASRWTHGNKGALVPFVSATDVAPSF